MTRLRDRMGTLARGTVALTLLCAVAVGTLARPVTAQETDLGSLSGQIAADGSSTVGPITQAVAEEFNAQAPDVKITVDISGTGGGFKRFCRGRNRHSGCLAADHGRGSRNLQAGRRRLLRVRDRLRWDHHRRQ